MPRHHCFYSCSPTSDGSAAAIVASEDFVRKHGLEDKAVEIIGMEMGTDLRSTFEENSCIKMVGRVLVTASISCIKLVGRVLVTTSNSCIKMVGRVLVTTSIRMLYRGRGR